MGVANSNYGGTNSVFLNPSLIVDSKVYIDVNLAGTGAFAWNNYVYYDKDELNFYRLIIGTQNDVNPRDNYSITDKNGLVSLFAHGPSTTFHLKGLHALGFHTKLRNYIFKKYSISHGKVCF